MRHCTRSLCSLTLLLLLCATGCDDTEEDASPAPPANNQNNDAGQDLDDGGTPDPNPTPSPDVGNPEDVGMDAEPTPEPEDVSDPDDAPEACLAFNVLAESALLPVDIVWIIDASPSMGEEIAIIEENLNVFAGRIGASALDYRVVIIGSDRDYCGEAQCYLPICVPPPLSAAATCPDVDSDRYRHIREGVHSRDGLDVAIATADRWLDFLRPEALTHFVMVTDDNSGFGADAEDFSAFMAQNTATLGTVRFHSIVDLIGYQPGCGVFDDEECSCGEERGQTYIDLSERTEGLVQSVCEEDWDPIFEGLETRVREGTELPCTFQIPDPGEDRALDPDEVNVVFFSEDRTSRTLIPQVGAEEDCVRASGWYYDDPAAPTLIHLCPEVCAMEADIVEVEIGCETVKN